LDAAMRLIGHGAIAVAIAALLILLEPVGALVAGGIALFCYGFILLFANRSLARLGRIRGTANQERFQVAQEAFGGLKEVKVLDLEDSYLQRFREPARRMADAHARAVITAELPRHALEGIAIGGMLAFVLWLLAVRGGQLESVLPVLGAYAFAGARLFPELQQVFRSLARMRFGRSALDELYADLHASDATLAPLPAMPSEPRLRLTRNLVLRNITYTYPEAARPSLLDLSLEIEAKTTVGLVGETGAGKSTVVDIILGLLAPQSGDMLVDGTELNATNVKRWRRSVGYVPQSIYLADKSLAENIAFGVPAGEIDFQAVERAARTARLHEFASQLPAGYQTKVGERGARLSGGQRQRVAIARALYRDPDVLVFDEATSALDTATEKAVLEAVEQVGREKTIILVTHRLSTLRRCDRIFILEDGRIAGAGVYNDLASGNRAFQRIHEAAP
jgi:ATP-binding cassette, subfamily B, bacterial PglK